MPDEIKQATLVKGEETRVVPVDSPEAQQAFGEGFTLPEAVEEPVITADALTPEADIGLPDITEDTDTGEDLVAGAGATAKTLEDFVTELTPEQTETEIQQADLSTQVQDLLKQTGALPAEQLRREEELGLPRLQKQFADINAQILTKSAEYEALKTRVEGQPITMGDIIGQQAQIEKAKASELGLLQARALGLQGQIENAQATADRAIDLKFKVQENNIAIYQAQLDALAPQLTKEQNILAKAQQAMLDQRKEEVEEEKEEEKAVQAVVLQAQANGADANLLDQISNAKTEVEAAQIAGKLALGGGWEYVATPEERDRFIGQGYEIVNGVVVERTDLDKGIVGGFDISRYATDPNHESAVASIISRMGKLETSDDMEQYLQAQSPGTPITAEMIQSTSEKFGVSWEMLIAMMQQDSSLGTAGKGARTFNPGNVGNNDRGDEVNYGDWQTGVDAVGAWLNRHKASIEITPELELQAKNLSTKIFGKRAGTKPENFNLIIDRLKANKTIDQIEDELRFSSESALFTGSIRDASESIGSLLTEAKRENLFNTIDRSLEENNMDRVRDILVKSAIDSFGVEEAKSTRGTQRTLEFLDEIADDLQKYEDAGGKTGVFEGNLEKVAGRVGKVQDPELRRLATKIQTAIQKYRRAMSGVAFSVPESREYAAIFPNIDKSKEFNTAVLSGLRDVMRDDFEFLMSNRMGGDAYEELFGDVSSEDGLSDEEAYQEYLRIKNE